MEGCSLKGGASQWQTEERRAGSVAQLQRVSGVRNCAQINTGNAFVSRLLLLLLLLLLLSGSCAATSDAQINTGNAFVSRLLLLLLSGSCAATTSDAQRQGLCCSVVGWCRVLLFWFCCCDVGPMLGDLHSNPPTTHHPPPGRVCSLRVFFSMPVCTALGLTS